MCHQVCTESQEYSEVAGRSTVDTSKIMFVETDKGIRDGGREGQREGQREGGRAFLLMDPEAAKPDIISEKGTCQKSIAILSVSASL